MSSQVVRLEIVPTRPYALFGVAILNVIVFAAWQGAVMAGPDELQWMNSNFLVSSDGLVSGALWTLLTSVISHASPLHLTFNMWGLWLFGREVEPLVGPRGFLHLYVAGGITASIGHVLYCFATGVSVPALGASGAVMAVAVVTAMLFPRRRVLLFFFIPMTLRTAVGLFVVMDVLGVFSPLPDRVAHAAHLGGALYGLLYARFRAGNYLRQRLQHGDVKLFSRSRGPAFKD